MSNIDLQLLYLSQDENSDESPLYLLSQGANPNFRDRYRNNWTSLHYAVFYNKEDFSLQLLNHSKINAKLLDSDGFSALYWAAKKSTPTIIKALLSAGCDINNRNMHGMTALFSAVSANKIENVEILASHPSININQINQYGGSALHHTALCSANNVEIADILVKNGADLFLIDYEKQYPLHAAKKRGKKKLFKYFQTKMKKQNPNWHCDVLFDELTIAKSVKSKKGNLKLHNIEILSRKNPKSQTPLKYNTHAISMSKQKNNLTSQNCVFVKQNKKLKQSKPNFKTWFVNKIGIDYMCYYECFVNSGFDNFTTMVYLTNNILIEIGINKKGHRLHILDQIKKYNCIEGTKTNEY